MEDKNGLSTNLHSTTCGKWTYTFLEPCSGLAQETADIFTSRYTSNYKPTISTLKPARSWAMVVRSRLWIMIKYPPVVHMIILEASGFSLVRINPFVWKTRLYTKPLSV